MDYAKELEKYADASPEDRADLEKLAQHQRDISEGTTVEDFVRHPFFKKFENKMNAMIADEKGTLLKATTIEELKAHQAAVNSIVELKKWINSLVMKGRFAQEAISRYEKDTDNMNAQIQEVVDKNQPQ